ncbi:MAG TPA: hypothetical protein VIG89_00555 [Candidatus Acidoferrales bacterium]
MRRFLFVLIVLLCAAGAVAAQSAALSDPAKAANGSKPADEQTALIKALLERMTHLEERIAELEARQPAATAASAPAAEPSTAVASAAKSAPAAASGGQGGMNHPGMGQSNVPEQEMTFPSLKISGFADVVFSATDESNVNSGFNLGQLVLHMASPLSKKVSYFGEVSFTATATGYNVEVERSIIRYDRNDYFKLSFGRYHTPVSYWNTAFHHGSWLQTTISRPEMIKFGSRLLPVHFIGFLSEGEIRSGNAGLSYSAGVGNGRGATISRGGDAGDVNNNRAWLLNLNSRPSKPYGLQFGGTIYRDKLSPGPGLRFNEWISSAYLAWTHETPEFLAEFSNVHHFDVNTSRKFNTQAFYVQLAYRLPFAEKKWKPYYRFDYINRPATETVLGITDFMSSTVGMRWDISDFTAFKGEYRNTKKGPGQPHINGLFIQTSFTF